MTDKWITKSIGGGITADKLTEPHIDENLLDELAVILIQGTNLFGDEIYSYVQMTLRNMREFSKKMRARESFKPSDFGTVLQAGRGEPPQDVRSEMAATYKMIDVPMPKPAAKAAFVQPKFFGDEEA